jgi:hypothetical protein
MSTRAGRPRWPAYAVAGWMALFAGLHAYWAFGGGAGLPNGVRVPDRPVLLAIDVLAIPLCLAGAVIALALVRPWGRQLPRRPLIGALCAAAVLAFVHSAPTMTDDLLGALGLFDLNLHTEAVRLVHFVFEPLWMAGGLLCGLAVIAAQAAAPGVSLVSLANDR